MSCNGLVAFMAMTLAASMRGPAEGAALIQSSQPELGRSAEIRETPSEKSSAFKEKAPAAPASKAGSQVVAGFFIHTVVSKEHVSLIQSDPVDDPEADRLLQLMCGVILLLLVCAMLAMFVVTDEMRPKQIGAAPSELSAGGLLHHAATRSVPLSATPGSLRPVQTWPVVESREDQGDTRELLVSQQSSLTNRLATESMLRGRSKSQHLCQGLVVPGGSECVLAVRLPQPAPPGSNWLEVKADVMDLTGKAVLVATLRPPSLQALSKDPAVVLSPTSAQTVSNQELARCYASRGSDGEIGIDICKATGEVYGRLARDPSRPRYVLTKMGSNPMPPLTLLFDGLFKEHAVLASDGIQAEPAADAEPCSMSFDPQGTYYRLRVSSNVDVGLMICCLLSIDELVRLGA